MHTLLLRQIRKFLPEHLFQAQEIKAFLEAVNRSYANYDEKALMLQRAMSLSSDELSEANTGLRKEAKIQKKILRSLEKVIESLEGSVGEDKQKAALGSPKFNPLKLAEHLEKQADEIVRMTSEKDNLLKDLEKQNEALNNYAHMVSHDLKSPIRNISTLLSWIAEEEGNKFSKESVQNFKLISQNLTKMDNLIGGILRYSALDSLDEDKTNVDLNQLIEEITSTIYVPDTTEIRLTGELPVIYMERYKAEQLFKNLLTNAVTATEHLKKGEITISSEEKPDYWKFSVVDNGVGIPDKYRTSVFQMFKKLRNDASSTGIGLALVKKIVSMNQGKIWLDSKENVGTKFFFTFKKYDA